MDKQEMQRLFELIERIECVEPSFERKICRHVFAGKPDYEEISGHLERCEKCRASLKIWQEKSRQGQLVHDSLFGKQRARARKDGDQRTTH